MSEKWIWYCLLGMGSLLLMACTPTAVSPSPTSAPHATPATPEQPSHTPATQTKENPTPSPESEFSGKSTPAPTATPIQPIMPETHETTEIPTPAQVAPPNQPEAILIYGPTRNGRPVTDTEEGNTPYETAVHIAILADLAQRTNTPTDQITILTSTPTEHQPNTPCNPTPKTETNPATDAITLGYEIILQANNQTYRYVAIGALAYYCGHP
ncbi:MAG: hypothetical protein D6706_04265 [Chloroflexi bacterium]|nr:MAG: hypothetical protein D6706_04265 [Chloroflexota bacterium]